MSGALVTSEPKQVKVYSVYSSHDSQALRSLGAGQRVSNSDTDLRSLLQNATRTGSVQRTLNLNLLNKKLRQEIEENETKEAAKSALRNEPHLRDASDSNQEKPLELDQHQTAAASRGSAAKMIRNL